MNRPRVKLGTYSLHLPRSRPARVGLGLVLLSGGFLGFLPILGFWMAPLGLIVLSVDIAFVRRYRRQIGVWWERRRRSRATTKTAGG